jgi:ATP-dependent DNA helicase RecG
VSILLTPLSSIQSIPPKKLAILKKECRIETYGDLLNWYPFRYVDRTKFYQVKDIAEDMPHVQLVGKLERIQLQGDKRKQRLTAFLRDPSGVVELVWFQGIKYAQDKIVPGANFIVFGKPTLFNGKFNIPHPELELYSQEKAERASKLQPVYNSTDAMKRSWLDSRGISLLIQRVLSICLDKIPETIPESLRQNLKLIPLGQAIKQIHQPIHAGELNEAQQRLKFEELFFLQLKLLRQNRINKQSIKGFAFEKIGNYFNDFYANHLPFELTGAQKRVLKEIRADVAHPIQMNRLVQGDVGSGKTIVAFMSMLMALDNGYQACLMAPTEILAQQHFEGLKDLAGRIGVSLRILTGSSRKKERQILHAELESGELQILVGTHAVLEDKVQFKNLGFVVIDEQHRFGVAQRAKLWAKNSLPPHVLIMSATPIPRTLAMTLYGDLDISLIDELPPGRKPVFSKHHYERDRPAVFEFLRQQMKLGRQIYIVYPLIEESEQLDYKNLVDGYEHLQAWFPQPEYHLSMVHGRMKSSEKEYEMQRFVKQQTQLMVATTVIEVGVNVPNASVMVIESAERFGLSQLHQLRGRVGRGADQSYCLMMTGFKLSNEARKRLDTMEETNDGFRIAEVDLELRGPGDLQGTQQSGALDLHIADISRDSQLLAFCRELATSILNQDPLLEGDENQILLQNLQQLEQKKLNWGRIS